MTIAPASTERPSRFAWPWAGLLVLPLVGLVLLLARPELDHPWEHHPSHFWLVLVTSVVNVALAYLTNVVAGRHRDARLVLVSLAFLASAGFLGLHALATPGVLLSEPNTGFLIATPVGLFIASVFAAASVSSIAGPRAASVLGRRSILVGGLIAIMVVWAGVSMAGLPPLDRPPPAGEAAGPVTVLAAVGVAFFVFAAWRSVGLYRRRGGMFLVALAVALVLLAEAMIAVALSRNWRLSWWEWHLLMLFAFVAIALGARQEYRRSGSLTGAFGGLYLEATLARIDRWHAGAIGAVAAADERGEGTEQVLDDLRREGASSGEVGLIAQAAIELRRLDAAFRPFLPAPVAEGLRHGRDTPRSAVTRLGGEERDVSALFADLVSFTTFSETRPPTEVLSMLNEYWAVVVPAIDAAGGVIEHFAGDGVMVIFNAVGDQLDHASRAATTGLAIAAAGRSLAETHADWPLFRVGVNTGPAVVGNVGAMGRRSFAAIGDTINTAARLTAVGSPGQVVVGRATWDQLGPEKVGEALGPTHVKGKAASVDAWVLRSLA